jgi:hypothetical protein
MRLLVDAVFDSHGVTRIWYYAGKRRSQCGSFFGASASLSTALPLSPFCCWQGRGKGEKAKAAVNRRTPETPALVSPTLCRSSLPV